MNNLKNKLKQLKQNNHLHDGKIEFREIEEKLNHGIDIRQDMKARIDDIQKTMEDLFNHAQRI